VLAELQKSNTHSQAHLLLLGVQSGALGLLAARLALSVVVDAHHQSWTSFKEALWPWGLQSHQNSVTHAATVVTCN
jgi:hypothetical protein